MNIEPIRRELAPLSDHDVVLFGSILTERFTDRSDIDVAVISRQADREANRRLWYRLLGTAPVRYDLRIFELLPLPMQIDIIEHHEVVYGDPLGLSEYFYRYRRLWKDQRPRYEANRFRSVQEKRRALQRAKGSGLP